MKVNGTHYRTIWEKADGSGTIEIIDQRFLPFEFKIAGLSKPEDFLFAISEMQVRGAPLIGVTAAYAVFSACLAADKNNFDTYIAAFVNCLLNTRPTAVNLAWAAHNSLENIKKHNTIEEKTSAALEFARKVANEDIESCKNIGDYGFNIINELSQKKNGKCVNILTHCNAGWLATVDYGTATAPIYRAFDSGIDIHVWVDETRPRNQGARLTAWELSNHGVPNTIIVDNAGGYLMQQGMADLVLVGSDRTTGDGYVVNKTGTYLKALAAADNGIPFYAALPLSTIDLNNSGIDGIVIEKRDENEVLYTEGFYEGRNIKIRTGAMNAKAENYAFDITPPGLITGLITDKGIIKADKEAIGNLMKGVM